ncbi:MAG: hypothetical protein ACYC8V_12735, partial [Caulobacteraceae bacterium]
MIGAPQTTATCPGSTTLAHASPSDTAHDVTLAYGYDEAGRELGRQYGGGASYAAFLWSATTGTTSYAAASNLNQYPSVGSYPYTWQPEGPLNQNDKLQNNYDEQNQLTLAFITVTPGVKDQNDWWQAQTDPLGHRMYHERQTTLGTAYPLIYEATDGLRPETVLDWQYSVLGTNETFQGFRRYVLGP